MKTRMRVPSPKTRRRGRRPCSCLLASWLAPWGCLRTGGRQFRWEGPQDGATPADKQRCDGPAVVAPTQANGDRRGRRVPRAIAEGPRDRCLGGGRLESRRRRWELTPPQPLGTRAADHARVTSMSSSFGQYHVRRRRHAGRRGSRRSRWTGRTFLTGPAVNALFWGSTFWTAPESDWQTNPAGCRRCDRLARAHTPCPWGTDSRHHRARGRLPPSKGKQSRGGPSISRADPDERLDRHRLLDDETKGRRRIMLGNIGR